MAVKDIKDVYQIVMELIVQQKLIQDGSWENGPDATDTAEKIMEKE